MEFVFATTLAVPLASELLRVEARTQDGEVATAFARPFFGSAAQQPIMPDPPVVEAAASSELKLHIDKPVVMDGAATQRIGGSFFVEGWAVARAGVEAVQIALDGNPSIGRITASACPISPPPSRIGKTRC